MSQPSAGWYPDPQGRPIERWWDGQTWTGQVRQPPHPASVAPPQPPSRPPHGHAATPGSGPAPQPAPTPAAGPAPQGDAPTGGSWRWVLLTGILAVAVLAAVGGWWLVSGGSDDPQLTAPEEAEPPPLTDALQWQRLANDEALLGDSERVELTSVVAGGPGLVAVGEDRGRNAAAVWTSTDGTSWQRVPHDDEVFGDATMYAVTTGGPGLVAVGSHAFQGFPIAWTSTDGTTWQRQPDEVAALENRGQMLSVVAGGPGLVAVGHGGSRQAAVWTSTDGTTWQQVPHDDALFGGDDGTQVLNSVTVGGPGLVAVGHSLDPYHALVLTSTDGTTWRRVPDDQEAFASPQLLSVTSGGPGMVAVGYDVLAAGSVWTATDGNSWQRVPPDAAAFGELGPHQTILHAVTAGGPGLIAVGEYFDTDTLTRTAAVWTSTDGIAWQLVPDDEAVFGQQSDDQWMNAVIPGGAGGPDLIAVGWDRGRDEARIWVSP